MKLALGKLLRSLGVQTHLGQIKPQDVAKSWIERLEIDLVLDVGANEGQFVKRMHSIGYQGAIISFEPLREAFKKLENRNKASANWRGFQIALGERDDELTMEVAGNAMMSSSLLSMLPNHVEALPESAIFKTEKVKVQRLDQSLAHSLNGKENVFLKIDTQGFEDKVLNGASGILNRVALIEIELSLVSLYKGQMLLPAMMDKVVGLGYVPVDLARGFADNERGKLLQVDGLFVRHDMADILPLSRTRRVATSPGARIK